MEFIGGVRAGFDSLDFLVKITEAQDVCIEVGSFCGESTFHLAKSFKKVYAVDSWEGGYDDADLASRQAKEAYILFLKNLLEVENVYPIKITSIEASKIFPDQCADLVYIDADHSEKALTQDVEVWSLKVRKGGILAGHDFDNSIVRETVTRIFPEVNKAGVEWWVRL